MPNRRPSVAAFRRGTRLGFLLVVMGVISIAALRSQEVAGAFLVVGGVLLTGFSITLTVNVGGLAARVRHQDFPPGIYFAIVELLRIGHIRHHRERLGAWGVVAGTGVLAVGVRILAGGTP